MYADKTDIIKKKKKMYVAQRLSEESNYDHIFYS